jgi:hypothetical protein
MPKLKEGKGREIIPIFSLRHAIFCGFGSGFVDNPFFLLFSVNFNPKKQKPACQRQTGF